MRNHSKILSPKSSQIRLINANTAEYAATGFSSLCSSAKSKLNGLVSAVKVVCSSALKSFFPPAEIGIQTRELPDSSARLETISKLLKQPTPKAIVSDKGTLAPTPGRFLISPDENDKKREVPHVPIRVAESLNITGNKASTFAEKKDALTKRQVTALLLEKEPGSEKNSQKGSQKKSEQGSDKKKPENPEKNLRKESCEKENEENKNLEGKASFLSIYKDMNTRDYESRFEKDKKESGKNERSQLMANDSGKKTTEENLSEKGVSEKKEREKGLSESGQVSNKDSGKKLTEDQVKETNINSLSSNIFGKGFSSDLATVNTLSESFQDNKSNKDETISPPSFKSASFGLAKEKKEEKSGSNAISDSTEKKTSEPPSPIFLPSDPTVSKPSNLAESPSTGNPLVLSTHPSDSHPVRPSNTEKILNPFINPTESNTKSASNQADPPASAAFHTVNPFVPSTDSQVPGATNSNPFSVTAEPTIFKPAFVFGSGMAPKLNQPEQTSNPFVSSNPAAQTSSSNPFLQMPVSNSNSSFRSNLEANPTMSYPVNNDLNFSGNHGPSFGSSGGLNFPSNPSSNFGLNPVPNFQSNPLPNFQSNPLPNFQSNPLPSLSSGYVNSFSANTSDPRSNFNSNPSSSFLAQTSNHSSFPTYQVNNSSNPFASNQPPQQTPFYNPFPADSSMNIENPSSHSGYTPGLNPFTHNPSGLSSYSTAFPSSNPINLRPQTYQSSYSQNISEGAFKIGQIPNKTITSRLKK